MRQSRELAQVNEAKGYRWGDELILRISGDKPSPCYQVDIEEMPMTIFPPEFAATQAPDPLAFCTEVITPYERVQVFRVGGGEFDTVTLHAAGGDIEVPIERIEAGDLARGVDPPEAEEAVGYSYRWDVGEAIRDAIGKLPDRGAGIPDWLSTYTVVAIGAEVGGIAGVNRLTARVRG
jgi:hypothetical protein